MHDKTTPIAEQFRPIIAQAFDEGWTTMDLRDAFEQATEIERDARMNVAAAKVYGADRPPTFPPCPYCGRRGCTGQMDSNGVRICGIGAAG